ncbi:MULTISPECIES: rhomboid family intramembrane serine protease [unclassified Flavobacterium]|uniref:rhomboid family intramembrane serine protease n=1 Tax=unclassified Flavobacterium TaxID=196869 RepID=UPI0012919DF5|nr:MULTISPECIES: rhomboid family intramembrane serine protease [unclassified Flavobacterium]MQP53160.1 rhomboid family intramembrane serine protease [Flavobacterium sp. LMO9]MQP63009.1 rhomboid family intramembrane serine protease [Flavobacterium sp. LMO6]
MNIILLLLIGVNALISYKAINDSSFFRKYEFHIGSIKSGEQLRMFSSGFLHVDFQHLFFNMFTLYFFAPYVIYNTTVFYFLYIYIGSLLAGNLLTFYFHKNDYSYRAVGASGAVTGVIFSAILLEPNLYMYGFIPGYIFGFAYLLFSIYGMKAKNDNIGHVAHFGGAIGGYGITLAKYPELISSQTTTVVALLVPIVVLFILQKMNKL